MDDVEGLSGGEPKVVVIGQSDVGKTSITLRFVRNTFEPTTNTIGASFQQKHVRLPSGEAITLQIWDTAGQERFRAMAPLYYRGAKAAIVVFDLTVRETFDQAKNWVDELRRFVSPGCQLFLAANKADKVESGGGRGREGGGSGASRSASSGAPTTGGGLRQNSSAAAVDMEEAKAYASSLGATLYRTSAKTGEKVHALFEDVAARLLKQYREERAVLARQEMEMRERRRQSGVGITRFDYLNEERDGVDLYARGEDGDSASEGAREGGGCC